MKGSSDLFSQGIVDTSSFCLKCFHNFWFRDDNWVIGRTRQLDLPAYQTLGLMTNKLILKAMVHPFKCCRKRVLHVLWGLHCLWMTEGRKGIFLCVVLSIGGDMVDLIMFTHCKGASYTVSCVTYTVRGDYSAAWSFDCSIVIVWWTGMACSYIVKHLLKPSLQGVCMSAFACVWLLCSHHWRLSIWIEPTARWRFTTSYEKAQWLDICLCGSVGQKDFFFLNEDKETPQVDFWEQQLAQL